MYNRRIKVFESGTYLQGDFPKDRVKTIFTNIKDKVEGIFVHSSKWKNENKKPLNIGEFNNFEIKENGDKVEVFADINFNDKGIKYYEDGTLKGVSVEISNNILDKIAVLPIGTNPAIKGAEFEQEDTAFLLEFKESEEDMTREEVIASLTKEELEQVKLNGYDISITEHVEPVIKTENEIREEIKKEFEKKANVSAEVKEFMELNAKKITPAMKEVLTENNLKVIFANEDNIEFEEATLNTKNFIKDMFNKMTDIIATKPTEFSVPEAKIEPTFNDKVKEATEFVKKIYNR